MNNKTNIFSFAALILFFVIARQLFPGNELKIGESNDTKRHAKADNQLINGGFENGTDGWEAWGGEICTTAHTGKCGMMIASDEFKWKGIEQSIAIPENAVKVVVSGWMKADSVIRGKEEWSKADINIEFKYAGGKRIGDYPPTTGAAVGKTDWAYFQKSYRVRPGTAKINVTCALEEAKGRAFYDDIKLTIYDKDGNAIKRKPVTGPTDEGEWYPLDIGNTASGSHYVDWSCLLDAPAGKHGFLKVKDEEFRFEDGTPAKFFGVVICGGEAFVNKNKVDSLTSRLAKMGCNILRLHHLDATWAEPNIFGNTKGTRNLSADNMKILDYLIYSCKEKGIYIFLDILVHRDFTPEDGVEHKPPESGAKQVGYFSKKLIELQKEYATQLLTHKNEYTGLAYKDDPAIVLSVFINETTIYTNFGSDLIPEGPYRKELEGLWNNSKFKGKKLSSFGLNWDSDPRGVLENKKEGADVKESIEFLMSLEDKYYTDMYKHYHDLGIKYPLAGSNMPLPILAMLKSYTTVDFVANDAYWDHPQLWKTGGGWDRVKYAPLNNNSQLLAAQNNSIESVAYFKVQDKPFVIWGNHCYPNEFQLEGLLLLASYACLQGWNGVLQHEFDHVPLGADSLESFTISRQPEDIAMWVAAAPIFLRDYIKQAPGQIVESITEDMVLSDNSYSDFLEKNYFLPFVTRVAKVFGKKGSENIKDYHKYYDEGNQIFRSETGELLLDSKEGILQINAPKVQGVLGFLRGQTFKFPLFETTVKNTHASVIAISRDNKPLTESKHYYLVVVGPSKMTGQKFKTSRTSLEVIGSMPIRLQVIDGKVIFKNRTKKNRMKVFPLKPTGKAGKAIKLTPSENGMVLDLSKGRTHVYEVKMRR